MFATFSVASTFAAFAAAAPLLKRAEVPTFAFNHVELATASFGNFSAVQGLPSNLSCGAAKVETDFTASIKTNSTNITEVCGQTINITNLDTGAFVLAQVVDECLDCAYEYLALSPAAFANVSKAENFTASYVFTNASAPARAAAAPEATHKIAQAHGSTSSVDSQNEVAASKPTTSSSSSKVHTPSHTPSSSSSSKHEAEKTTSSSSHHYAAPSSTSKTWTPEHSSSSSSSSKTWTPEHTSTSSSSKKAEWTPTSSDKPEWTPESKTSSSKKAEWTPTSSSDKPEWTPESKTSSSKKAEWTPETTSSKKAEYTPKAEPKKQASSGGQYSGQATYYYQNGNPGACGNYNSDGAYIVALQSSLFAGGAHCGQQVRINSNGNSITATVADECPTCVSSGSLDLSVAAFQALGSMSSGVLPISWSFA